MRYVVGGNGDGVGGGWSDGRRWKRSEVGVEGGTRQGGGERSDMGDRGCLDGWHGVDMAMCREQVVAMWRRC